MPRRGRVCVKNARATADQSCLRSCIIFTTIQWCQTSAALFIFVLLLSSGFHLPVVSHLRQRFLLPS